jgi:hypothetical protein
MTRSRSKTCMMGMLAMLPMLAGAQIRLNETTPGTNDEFGISVTLDGNHAAVGAYQFTSSGPGRVVVFERDTFGNWSQQTGLVAPDGVVGDRFGERVAMSGNRLFVSAFTAELSGGRTEAGAVYLFEESAGVWSFSQKLTASDAATGDRFGASLSISGDRLLVGSYLADAPTVNSGAAYVFDRDGGGVWNETAKLVAADADTDDRFGWSLGLDGDRALIGAYVDDNAGGVNAGSAYVFDFAASTWTQTAKILNDEALPGDTLGRAVALDWPFAVISALGRDEGGVDGGAAYIFEDVAGSWIQRSKLTSNAPADDGLFGWNVRIEGTTAVVAEVGATTLGATAGMAHVFRRDIDGVWPAVLRSAAPNTSAGDAFGVSVWLDGDRVLCGAIGDDDGGTDSGAAWILTIPPSSGAAAGWSLYGD